MEPPYAGPSGETLAYLCRGHRGEEVLRHLLDRGGWRPGLIVRLAAPTRDGSVPILGAADKRGGIPLIEAPSLDSPGIWYALAANGIQGVLAVGVAEAFEESFLNAFPLGVYALHAGSLPAMAGPAALNWAIIRGMSETGTALVRYTGDGDGCAVVAQASCRIGERETAGALCTKVSALSAELWALHWPGIIRNDVPLRPVGRLEHDLRRRPEDGLIRWASHSAATLDRWIRALAKPYPGAYFWCAGRRIWVHCVERLSLHQQCPDGPTLAAVSEDGMTLDFPDGRLRISDLCLDGGTEMASHVLAELAERAGDRLSSLHTGQRVLVVAAHPDDEVLGVGGTLIRHFQRGDEIRAVIVCSAASIRYREDEHDQPGDAQRASHYLGTQSQGLGFADQRLDSGSNLELIQAVEREIQGFQPQTIYTHWWGDVNADHTLIAEAVDVAARPYAAPFVDSVYAFEAPSSTEWTVSARARPFAPNVFVDITDGLDRKLDAMRCYRSELRPYPHPRSIRSLQERAGYWGSVANMKAAEPLVLLRERR